MISVHSTIEKVLASFTFHFLDHTVAFIVRGRKSNAKDDRDDVFHRNNHAVPFIGTGHEERRSIGLSIDLSERQGRRDDREASHLICTVGPPCNLTNEFKYIMQFAIAIDDRNCSLPRIVLEGKPSRNSACLFIEYRSQKLDMWRPRLVWSSMRP